FARAFDNVDGHFEYALPVAVFYAQAIAHPAYLFAMLTPLFFVGVARLTVEWNATAEQSLAQNIAHKLHLTTPAVLLLGWIAAMLFFLMGIPYENFRFSLG